LAPFASVFARLLFVGALLFGGIATALAEDDRVEALKEWYNLADKRTDFEVSDPALLPSRLVRAVKSSGCRYEEGIKEYPVSFMKLGSRRLAIVFCRWVGMLGTHQLFDLTNLQQPRLIELPILAQPEGIVTTPYPGIVSWNKDSGIFQAWRSSDMLPTLAIRHTYRFSEDQGSTAFVLVRVEVQRIPGPDEWVSMWDAPRWSFPSVAEPPSALPSQQK
jgi:hypothetical protein